MFHTHPPYHFWYDIGWYRALDDMDTNKKDGTLKKHIIGTLQYIPNWNLVSTKNVMLKQL